MIIATKYTTATPWLNVRNAPAGQLLYHLLPGTDITVITDNPQRLAGFTWLERAKYRGQWVALEYLSDTNPVTPPVIGLKIGLHLAMYNYDAGILLATLKLMHSRGRWCPGVLVLGPSEIAFDTLHNASPNTILINRQYYDGDQSRGVTAEEYFGRFVFPDKIRAKYRYHQINNENNDGSPEALRWWLDQMAWAESHGYRLVVPTFSTGNPSDLNFWLRPDVAAWLRYIRDHGHLLAFHEYFRDDGDWELFRFLNHVYPMLPADLKANMPNTVITEFGVQKASEYSDAGWLSMMRTWQAVLAPVPWIKAVMVWTYGDTGASTNPGQDWRADNWSKKIGIYPQV